MYVVDLTEFENLPYDSKAEKFIEGCAETRSRKTYYFKTKKTAWDFFKQSLTEWYGGRDFWADLNFDDVKIESSHWDEGGSNTLCLYKWEDFDNDVLIGWEYNGEVMYLNELWADYPIFEGKHMETDEPFIRSKDGKEIANLYVNSNLE